MPAGGMLSCWIYGLSCILARLLHGKTEAANRYTVHHLFKPTPRLLGFHKSEHRDHFNKGLKAIRQSGEYAVILNNYRND
jgi:ABC-type amino acid transport substrate-binding protein